MSGLKLRRAGGAALALGLGLSGCGGAAGADRTAQAFPESGAARSIVWAARPLVFRPSLLPRDRVILAHIRNRGRLTLKLFAARVVVRDARGALIPGATAAFTNSYAHGLFGALQQPSSLPVTEAARLGRLLYLQDGATTPLFVAWHLPAGAREPVSVYIGGSRLVEPAGPAGVIR